MVVELSREDIELSSDDSPDEQSNESNKKEKVKRHKKLLKDIGVKPGKTRKSVRNEPSKEISEYSWTTGQDSTKLQLHELVGSLKSTAQPVAKLKKKLRKMENTKKVLEKPLTKPETERIERTVAYQDTSTEISKWNPTVQKNRSAEQLVFPMNQYRPPPVSTKALVTNFKPQNDLEREINAVLQGSKHLLERKDKELTEAEEEALKSMDLEEALERRKELQRARALQSYYETKCRRMKKIKSKKYHRIMKKEQQKSMSKVDLETLSKENPELFQAELEKAEKMRALERANLRHRNTSKWAKNMIIKGSKKTKEDQEVVREQLRISRQLTEHKTIDDNSDTEPIIDNNDQDTELQSNLTLMETGAADNPWLLNKKESGDSDMVKEGDEPTYRKLMSIVTSESRQFKQDDDDDDDKSSGDEWDADSKVEGKKKKKTKKIKKKTLKEKKNLINGSIENVVEDGEGNVSDFESDQEYEGVEKLLTQEENRKTEKKKPIVASTKPSASQQQSNTMRFLQKDDDAQEIQQEYSSDEDEIIYDSEQRMNIREAFANDDVIADFIQEKNDTLEKAKPQATDLTLPGWGEWAGAGLITSSKKRKRFTKDAGPAPKRKDDGISNVIISEVRNKKLAKHQVSEVPFPYSNKAEFERSIRQPIGEHWNTPSVHNKLTEPRIRTLPGHVIDPLKPSKRLKKKLKKS